MLSCTRWLKAGYLLALATAVVLLLSKPEPIQAQRTLAYPFLPGAGATAAAMAALNATAATPMVAYTQAQQQLVLAGIPAGLGIGGAAGPNIGGGVVGMGGGGLGGGGLGMGGGAMGMGGGALGMGGGMMGMGGMNMGGGMGMGGGMNMGGMGGMGGFAGKGMGGFNGKKPL